VKMAMEVANSNSNGGRVVRGDAFAGNFAKGRLLRTASSHTSPSVWDYKD
jgi:hypothetical protein